MKVRGSKSCSPRRCNAGFKFIELMVATAVASMVLAGVGSLIMYSARSSAALVNYSDLDNKSRYALDVISRELRQSRGVLAIETNLPITSLTVTNSDEAAIVKVTYDANARTVVLSKTGQADLTALTECDQFNLALYQRTPYITPTNVLYYPATNTAGKLDVSACKLISLSWKCSRGLLAQKANTESVQAAQIILRNKR
jgi:type II secretory pathway component PulJ